jgi:hypothetical protein
MAFSGDDRSRWDDITSVRYCRSTFFHFRFVGLLNCKGRVFRVFSVLSPKNQSEISLAIVRRIAIPMVKCVLKLDTCKKAPATRVACEINIFQFSPTGQDSLV